MLWNCVIKYPISTETAVKSLVLLGEMANYGLLPLEIIKKSPFYQQFKEVEKANIELSLAMTLNIEPEQNEKICLTMAEAIKLAEETPYSISDIKRYFKVDD